MDMDMFLSHFSAAKYWGIPHLESILGSDLDLGVAYFTASSKTKIYAIKDCKIHLCKMELPKGGIVKHNGNPVASPELVFLQLASKISLPRLILLGLQICSYPPGNPNKSITSKKKLMNFINKTPGHMGQGKSKRALKYIENGSASIMESLAYMVLALPNALGGYGLSGAVFNYAINLNNEAGQRLNQQQCFADLYYKEEKIAVEYDSFAFHNTPREQGRDAVRSAILQRHGVEVMSMSTIQLYDLKACDDFAKNLAKRLGRRINVRAKEYERMRNQLRNLLPLK